MVGKGHIKVVKLLLKKDADFTVPTNNGWTLLYIVASKGYIEVVNLLLKKGAGFIVLNNNG